MKHPLNHGDMVANIVDTYQRASTDQLVAGRQWYPAARKLVEAIGFQTDTDTQRVCFALAALSPRNPWLWNVADTYSFAVARKAGRTMPTATTFKRNQRRAWEALGNTVAPWTTKARKVNAFVAAIMGDSSAVVVDTWAYRVATTVKAKDAVRDGEYMLVAAAYEAAARITGETPRDLQAITWLVAQTEGLASLRKGRHDLSFKAGTPDFVKDLLR